jgi:uncharacterized protein YdeI (YjbR/CyaY-like superfamily)
MKPQFFETGEKFYEWLREHHDKETELLVGFWKTGSGKPSMSWSESVDQALCFGWIDAVRKRIDDESYTIRFTKRRPSSIWSKINREKMERLIKTGKVHRAGLESWQNRDERKQNRYSFEQEKLALSDADLKEFKKHKKAWAFFEKQPPSYHRVAIWWIVSAKKAETHDRRLAKVIEESEAERRI